MTHNKTRINKELRNEVAHLISCQISQRIDHLHHNIGMKDIKGIKTTLAFSIMDYISKNYDRFYYFQEIKK